MPVPSILKRLLRRTGVLFVIFMASWIIPLVIDFPPKYEGRILTLLTYTGVFAFFLQLIIWINTLVTYWTEQYITRHNVQRGDVTTIQAVAVAIRVAVGTFLVVLAFDALGKNVTGLIAGLGIGGIAIAFALQNILGDLFGAFSIVLDKPFVLGDSIQVDTMSGTVERIGLKSTRVRSDDGEEIVFANGELLKGKLRNFGRMQERRAVLALRVAGDTAPDALAQIPGTLQEVIEAQPDVRFGRAHLKTIGDTTIDFEAVYYLQKTAYKVLMDTQQTVILDVMRRLAGAGVELAVQLEAAGKQKVAGRVG